MGSVHQVSPGKAPAAAEINRHMRDEHKDIRGGISGEGQGLSEKDESNINEAGEAGSLAHQTSLQKQQQQVVQWEKFLPFRTLTVLLVENDDSTCQVLSALLRNCSYEVIVASNGLQAWKILEDLMNPIDLVLTEVVMPCLSGVGLLCKIMSHKICKNIPVIMMSSNDSMGTVFKCLSRGAVDFLIKPIRKNELKNLWQHVWRRSLSSSGSGSESGIQTQKSAKSNSADDSDNNTGSNDEDDNGSIGLNTRDGSDNGSGTQISWTKCAVEVDSPQPMSPFDHLADPHDSTCAQVIHPTIETFCNEWVPMTASRECQEQKGIADNFMGKDLKIGVPKNTGTHHESYPAEKVCTDPMGENADKLPDSDPKNEVVLGLESSNASDNQSNQAADLIGTIANSTDAQLTARVIESPDGFSKVSGGTDMVIDGSMELPSLELSLKRLRSTGESGAAAHDDRNILRRSDVSAFSRYNKSVASTGAPTGYGGSCSALDNRSEAGRTESTHKMISNLIAVPLNQGSNGSSANNDMGSSTNNAFTKPAALKEKMVYASSIKSGHPSAFHPMQGPTPTPQVMHEKIDALKVAAIVGHPKVIQHQVQLQHNHHHYHHHRLHAHNMQQLQVPTNHDYLMLKTLAAAAPHCKPSEVLSGPMEGNAANYSLHGSNSGSNHGSNGQNGSSTAVNIGGINMESANGISERSGAGGGNWSGIDSGVDQNRFAQREAALSKFRQKRKERNFQKKVRYQSRQKLAEQRPRVRGQFVRRIGYKHTSQEADS